MTYKEITAMITKTDLIKRLRDKISPDEWNGIMDESLLISPFNRSILSEMKNAEITDSQYMTDEKEIHGLYSALKTYLTEYMNDHPDGWKWIIISSIYLTFIAQRPMHPTDLLDIRITEDNGIIIYECPHKSSDKETTCHYCVCR